MIFGLSFWKEARAFLYAAWRSSLPHQVIVSLLLVLPAPVPPEQALSELPSAPATARPLAVRKRVLREIW